MDVTHHIINTIRHFMRLIELIDVLIFVYASYITYIVNGKHVFPLCKLFNNYWRSQICLLKVTFATDVNGKKWCKLVTIIAKLETIIKKPD